eukprot:48922-Chlamydomonas_euryale.AAC.5
MLNECVVELGATITADVTGTSQFSSPVHEMVNSLPSKAGRRSADDGYPVSQITGGKSEHNWRPSSH